MLYLTGLCHPPQLLCNTVLVMETAGANSLTVPLIAATFVAKVGMPFANRAPRFSIYMLDHASPRWTFRVALQLCYMATWRNAMPVSSLTTYLLLTYYLLT